MNLKISVAHYLSLAIIIGATVFTYLWLVPRPVVKNPTPVVSATEIKTATFAGGCFWCTEADFEKLPGVLEAVSGYMGGTADTATYKQTSAGGTGHREVVQIQYDTNQLSYKDLVDYHWRHFDPTDNDGQFYDRGFVYSPAVFYETPDEQSAAQTSLAELNALGVFAEVIQVPIVPASTFYPAEAYHQDYYLKNPLRYQYYRQGSGRDAFLQNVWPKN